MKKREGPGVGNIRLNVKEEKCFFAINSLNEIIQYVLPHFDQYPLVSKKLADYMLFRSVVLIMESEGHLTEHGLQKIVNIKASLNKGLTDKLIEAFPKTRPVDRPFVPEPIIPNPN